MDECTQCRDWGKEELHSDHWPPSRKRGSAQCPRCGRLSTIVRLLTDAGSAEVGSYAVVNCREHGEGAI